MRLLVLSRFCAALHPPTENGPISDIEVSQERKERRKSSSEYGYSRYGKSGGKVRVLVTSNHH